MWPDDKILSVPMRLLKLIQTISYSSAIANEFQQALASHTSQDRPMPERDNDNDNDNDFW